MTIEWECTLDCNYNCHYCEIGTNHKLETPIKAIIDEDKIYNFLYDLKSNYYNNESTCDKLYIFGGEPFLHPKIEFIIKTTKELQIPFVIQTNFSKPDFILKLIKQYDFDINISLHKQYLDLSKNFLNINKYCLQIYNNIQKIEIMYTDKSCLNIFDKLFKTIRDKTTIVPVASFLDDNDLMRESLHEFNLIKNSNEFKSYNFEISLRAEMWEDMMNKQELSIFSNINKPCLYNDYILFDPSFNRYSCNYRKNPKNNICENKKCFYMY